MLYNGDVFRVPLSPGNDLLWSNGNNGTAWKRRITLLRQVFPEDPEAKQVDGSRLLCVLLGEHEAGQQPNRVELCPGLLMAAGESLTKYLDFSGPSLNHKDLSRTGIRKKWG